MALLEHGSALPAPAASPVITRHHRVGIFQLLVQRCRAEADLRHLVAALRGMREELMPNYGQLIMQRRCRAGADLCHLVAALRGMREELMPN